jgi:hypothetical protein
MGEDGRCEENQFLKLLDILKIDINRFSEIKIISLENLANNNDYNNNDINNNGFNFLN